MSMIWIWTIASFVFAQASGMAGNKPQRPPTQSGGLAKAVDWAFLFANTDKYSHTRQELEYRRLAASKGGLNFVVGPNGPKIGECVAQ